MTSVLCVTCGSLFAIERLRFANAIFLSQAKSSRINRLFPALHHGVLKGVQLRRRIIGNVHPDMDVRSATEVPDE